MENSRDLIFYLAIFYLAIILSTVLTCVLTWLFFNLVNAYDQMNTHPALTDEIVDFYNLAYPDDQISNDFKQEMIKGAIEEDTPPRWLNHFYDPIYNQGWLGYTSAKEWAKNTEKQQLAFLQYVAIARVPMGLLDNQAYADYSWPRAIKDYATGNKKRAFKALGHIFHLLEDSNVPEHTRGDTHLPWHGTESPYEKTMTKWNPGNIDLAKPLFEKGLKSIILKDLDQYFDEVAMYSNNYFFSEDTINIPRYKLPKIIKNISYNNGSLLGLGKDKDGSEFILAKLNGRLIRNIFKIQRTTLIDNEIGTIILDDYWSRLTKHLIPRGAGLIKLFLTQARTAEKLYQERKIVQPNQSFFDVFVSIINPFGGEKEEVQRKNEQTATEIVSMVLSGQVPLIEIASPLVTSTPTVASPSTPSPTPPPLAQQTPFSSPKPEINCPANSFFDLFLEICIPIQPQESPKQLPSPSPSLSPIFHPSPSSIISPSPLISHSPTPTTSPSPNYGGSSAANQKENILNSCPEPAQKNNEPIGQVVINEIAWMGTDSSAADEWIELKNNTGQTIDLTCWQIIAEDGTPKIKLWSKIEANGFYLLERTDDNTIKDILADHIYTGALSNSGEILRLYDQDGNLQDIVGHKDSNDQTINWYAGDNSTKSSMERKNSTNTGNDKNNWQTNNGITRNGHDSGGNPINGTPKAKNSQNSLGESGSSRKEDNNQGGDNESPLLKIVINEIAWMGTSANQNDEWIEIYNPSSKSVDLTGWILKSFKIKNGILTADTPEIIFSTKSIDPFGYLLLERTNDNVVSDIKADLIFTGSLNNNGEILELRDNQGQLQDKVGNLNQDNTISSWYAGENNTSSDPPARKTMERVDAKKFGFDPTNWQTNNGIVKNGIDEIGNQIFGTPRKINSVQKNKKPEKISDLTIDLSKTKFGNISVFWTSPNDPDNLSQDLTYDFRYATSSFGQVPSAQEIVWQSARKILNLPSVAFSGTIQSVSFNVWQYNSNLYFAIRTFDGKDYSELSNEINYFVPSALENSVWPLFALNNHNTGQIDTIGPNNPEISWQFDFSQFDPYRLPFQPVIALDGRIYLGLSKVDGRGYLVAISKYGQLLWRWPNEISSTTYRPSFPAVFSDNSVYFGQRDHGQGILAFSEDGLNRWSYWIGEQSIGLNASKDGKIYATNENNILFALNPDGTLNWKFDFLGTSILIVNQIPVIDEENSRVYIAGESGGGNAVFTAFDLKNGQEIWRTGWQPPIAKSQPSFISFDKFTNKLYASARNNILEINPENGQISAFPIVLEDGITRWPKTLVSIDSVNNSLITAFDFTQVNPSSGTKNVIYSFNKQDKTINWSYEISDNIAGKLIVLDNQGNLYFTTENGKLYSLDKNGNLKWIFEGDALIESVHPVIDKDGSIYQTFGTKLYKFK